MAFQKGGQKKPRGPHKGPHGWHYHPAVPEDHPYYHWHYYFPG